MKAVASGEALLAPEITRRLIERFAAAPQPRDEPRLQKLSERETEVLQLVAQGLSNAEIATRLFLSQGTVKSHIGHVLAKLGLRDRVQAVVFAYEAGLVQPNWRPNREVADGSDRGR